MVRPRHCYLALCGHPREHPQERAGCARSSALTRPQAPLGRGLRLKGCGSSSAPPQPLELRLFLTKFTSCYFFLLLFSFYYLTFYYYLLLYYFPLHPPPFIVIIFFFLLFSFLSVFFVLITSPCIIFLLFQASAAMHPSSAGGSGRARPGPRAGDSPPAHSASPIGAPFARCHLHGPDSKPQPPPCGRQKVSGTPREKASKSPWQQESSCRTRISPCRRGAALSLCLGRARAELMKCGLQHLKNKNKNKKKVKALPPVI